MIQTKTLKVALLTVPSVLAVFFMMGSQISSGNTNAPNNDSSPSSCNVQPSICS